MKKLLDADTQTVAEFFDRGDRRAVISAADDVVDGGLGHTAQVAELVDAEFLFFAEIQNAQPYRFPDVHGYHHTFSRTGYPFLLEKLNPFEL